MSEKLFDCGIDCLIGDGLDTEFCHEYLRYEILANNLVGEYAENGEYIFNDETRNILVGCAKKLIETSKNKFKLEANIDYLKLTFEIDVLKNGNQLTSELYLLENIKDENPDFCHSHRTFVAEYVDDDNVYYKNKLFEVFNIYDKDDDKIKDFDQEEYCRKLIEKLKKNKTMQGDLIAYDQEFYKDYIKEVLKMLEGSGDKGKFILKRFSKFLKGMQNFGKNKGDYYKAMMRLNQLLLSSQITFTDEQKKKLDQIKKRVFSIEEVSFKNRHEKKIEKKKEQLIGVKEEKKSNKKKPEKKEEKTKKKEEEKKKKEEVKKSNTKENTVDWNYIYGFYVDDQHQKVQNRETEFTL